ncbi:hypothetical protein Tco_0633925 [Tanacetum coccineum]
MKALPTPSPAPTSEVPHEPQTDSSPAQTSEVPIEHQPNLSQDLHPLLLFLILSQKLLVRILEVIHPVIEFLFRNEGEHDSPKVSMIFDRLYVHSKDSQDRSFSKNIGCTKILYPTREEVCLKVNSSVQRDPLFDEIPKDTVDHMETENAQNEGRTREMVDEDKEIDENILSTEDVLSTDREEHIEGTEEHIEGTKEQVESTDGHKKGTEEEIATQATQTSTQTPILNIIPRPTSNTNHMHTLKPYFQRLIQKPKGNKKLKREWKENTDERWEEVKRKRNRIADRKAANEALIRNFVVASDDLRDALSVIFGLSELKVSS